VSGSGGLPAGPGPRRPWLAAAALLLLNSCGGDAASGPPAATTDPAVAAAAATITAADMARHVGWLAHDSMLGRETPSPEIDAVARGIAAEFARMGLRPGILGNYLQTYPVNGNTDTTTPPAALHRSPRTVSAPNVIAILDGGDSRVSHEYLLFVAHMDHLGVGLYEGTDSIFNGADDNASGTAAVLEIAEAFASMSPRPGRSIIFLLVSGEEHGLWGSGWFATHPVVPLTSIVGVLNFDMIGRNATDSVFVGGAERSTMGDAAYLATRQHPEENMRVVEGPNALSDHVPFGGRHIPWLFFFSGLHTDYHQVSDSADKINAEKAARIARMGFYTAWELANARSKPAWHPGFDH